MKTQHILYALADTARAYEGSSDVGQLICEALRGVVARASRYEAQEPEGAEDPWQLRVEQLESEVAELKAARPTGWKDF